ncbi:creatininase family protein [Rhodococcus sp. IEGM 1408]|uniref:creatininase family protein n=1 Tax=Rhodococcus sp. IEGM 1408 TaxID=3082220 RepID=UPI0029532E00|nr:creatininase family protein [Rhodococcus sp. IEGM 1408]MDV8001502.1 creatininase family protein [Rhodococcus sp. IEGM 1408]
MGGVIGPGRRYADLTTTEAGRVGAGDPIAVIPAGAIEPHGPHLPLATDLLVAEHVAAHAVALAAAGTAGTAGVDAWLMPPLGYTKSDEHANLPGALWISADTLFRQVVELGSALRASGFTRVLFVNCHGGNSALLEVALRELRRRFGLRTFLYAGKATPGPTELGMGIHAGWAETSMMLHLHPELVDMTEAQARVPAALADCQHIGFTGPVRFGWLADDLSDTGVIGDPTGADAATGERLVAEHVAVVAGALAEIAEFAPAASVMWGVRR